MTLFAEETEENYTHTWAGSGSSSGCQISRPEGIGLVTEGGESRAVAGLVREFWLCLTF